MAGFVVDRPDIDSKATVVRLAYESASDDGHDAFVFLGRLQSLERRVVKDAETQQVKDPIDQQLDSGGGVATFPWLTLRKREIVPRLSETTKVRSTPRRLRSGGTRSPRCRNDDL